MTNHGGAGDEDLRGKPHLPRHAMMRAFGELAVIVHKADQAETHGHEQNDPGVNICQFHPQQRADHDRDQDHQAAHGRRAFFLQMRFGAVAADRLAFALFHAQPADNARTKDETNDQRGQQCATGPERDVAEQIEENEIMRERGEEVIKQAVNPSVAAGHRDTFGRSWR